jgi:hypothetical protein
MTGSDKAQAPAWIERLIWPLIFGGLLIGSLGLFMRQGEFAGFAGLLLAVGVLGALVGALLIWLRSRWP